MDGEGHGVPGAMQEAGVGLVSCTLGLPRLSLVIASATGLPPSEAWEKQVPEWAKRGRGGQRAHTGSPGTGGEGSWGTGRWGEGGEERRRDKEAMPHHVSAGFCGSCGPLVPSSQVGLSFFQAQAPPNPLGQPRRPWQTHPLFPSQSKKKRGCAEKSKRNALFGSTSLWPHKAQFPIKDSSNHSIDRETEAPSGVSHCLSLTKCLGQGRGKQPMFNQCQRQLLSQSPDTSVLFGAISEMLSPHFSGPTPSSYFKGMENPLGHQPEGLEGRWRAPATPSIANLWGLSSGFRGV